MTQQLSPSEWDTGFGNQCRVGCGACCVAISISTTIPGMSGPKPAGVRCIQLTSDNRCRLYGKPERPDVCRAFQPSAEICGSTNDEAMHNLIELEALTSS
ncbi:MAG: YkgJ family cysteine cluster protein [Caldilineaceae bacterium]|nr:YkgJ family cysteine cluster protein [Caldilineaceae bacterium]